MTCDDYNILILIFFFRGRRRPRLFKLKFHHQALPQEYLDHYQASLRQELKVSSTTTPVSSKIPQQHLIQQSSTSKSSLNGEATRREGSGNRGSRPITIHESGSGATESLIREFLPPQMNGPIHQQIAASLSRAKSVPSVVLAASRCNKLGSSTPSPVPSIGDDQQQIKQIKKKGRKSRKNSTSDNKGLNQLINNNFANPLPQDMPLDLIQPHLNMTPQYSDIHQEPLNTRSRSYTSLSKFELGDQNEPLNLCVRDKSPLKLEEEEPSLLIPPEIKQEPLSNYPEIHQPPKSASSSVRSPNVMSHRESSRTPMSPPSLDWANNTPFAYPPHWMHDYRLKSEDGLSSGQSTPSLCSQSSHLPPISPNLWSHFSPPHFNSPSPSPMTPTHRNMHNLLKESLHLRFDEAARESITPQHSYMPSPDRMSTGTPTPGPPLMNLYPPSSTRNAALSMRGGARKKRSTMYIPHSEANAEVSMCKFKFTGGPNPMLEEKKMVSVDASGTMRYFSGEKCSGNSLISKSSKNMDSSIKLKNNEKLLPNINNITGCKDNKKIRLDSKDLCQDDPQSSGLFPQQHDDGEQSLDGNSQEPRQLNQIEDSPKRKRRSKKPSVRERFEQSLRERGLLIQTQQVESAEGATYCKFRQLRKITRYLFRNWKDHIPTGQMAEGGNCSQADGAAMPGPIGVKYVPCPKPSPMA